MNPADLTERFRVDHPERFRLAALDWADTAGLEIGKHAAKSMIAADAKRLAGLQERLYAEDRHSLLIVLQGMDTAGKDGVIEHVMSGVNPQGCEVHSFRAPSAEELDHDFLWRAAIRLPTRGRIGIFNRSYYEEVLVVRVHPEILARQKLPARLVHDNIWQERYEDIVAFERHLVRNGTVILKFLLHLSKQEQRRRLLARLDDPAKHWKFSVGDISERELWDRYLTAYEDMVRATSRPNAPWYVVPADNKWFTRLVVARALLETLQRLDPQFPTLDDAAQAELRNARAVLLAEGARDP